LCNHKALLEIIYTKIHTSQSEEVSEDEDSEHNETQSKKYFFLLISQEYKESDISLDDTFKSLKGEEK
jgi:hypothetical protein